MEPTKPTSPSSYISYTVELSTDPQVDDTQANNAGEHNSSRGWGGLARRAFGVLAGVTGATVLISLFRSIYGSGASNELMQPLHSRDISIPTHSSAPSVIQSITSPMTTEQQTSSGGSNPFTVLANPMPRQQSTVESPFVAFMRSKGHVPIKKTPKTHHSTAGGGASSSEQLQTSAVNINPTNRDIDTDNNYQTHHRVARGVGDTLDSTSNLGKTSVRLSIAGNGMSYTCSGVILSHDTVATAAHCFEGIYGDNISKTCYWTTIYFPDDNYAYCQQAMLHPLYNTNNKPETGGNINFDIALVKLKTSIPASSGFRVPIMSNSSRSALLMSNIELPFSTAANLDKTDCISARPNNITQSAFPHYVAYGYGHTGMNCDVMDFILRQRWYQREFRVSQSSPSVCRYVPVLKGIPIPNQSSSASVYRSCSGDSGGGVLMFDPLTQDYVWGGVATHGANEAKVAGFQGKVTYSMMAQLAEDDIWNWFQSNFKLDTNEYLPIYQPSSDQQFKIPIVNASMGLQREISFKLSNQMALGFWSTESKVCMQLKYAVPETRVFQGSDRCCVLNDQTCSLSLPKGGLEPLNLYLDVGQRMSGKFNISKLNTISSDVQLRVYDGKNYDFTAIEIKPNDIFEN